LQQLAEDAHTRRVGKGRGKISRFAASKDGAGAARMISACCVRTSPMADKQSIKSALSITKSIRPPNNWCCLNYLTSASIASSGLNHGIVPEQSDVTSGVRQGIEYARIFNPKLYAERCAYHHTLPAVATDWPHQSSSLLTWQRAMPESW
jgi:hypothetical protein